MSLRRAITLGMLLLAILSSMIVLIIRYPVGTGIGSGILSVLVLLSARITNPAIEKASSKDPKP